MNVPAPPGYRLAPQARIIVLATCGHCARLAPYCLCGYPASRLAQAPNRTEEGK